MTDIEHDQSPLMTDKKQRAPVEPLLISDFPAAALLAEPLIREFHDELAEANIIYLCRNKAQKSGGRSVPGSVKKATPMEKHLGGHLFSDDKEPDFIITISLPEWNELNPKQRIAVVDHLLTRCTGEVDEKNGGEMKYKVRAPQVQEFPEVAERNGRYNDDLIEMGNCLQAK